ncbi:hypothetical protein GCM10011394_20430 [Luteimonas terricola]|uniref:Transposase n=1 Tax=Luteimonas terricola TaxID=645597 RepID=A0ABQ2EGH8_9GAMM|nr:hypothetical protein GCM10011394_20430 [Luteimonas terricola]
MSMALARIKAATITPAAIRFAIFCRFSVRRDSCNPATRLGVSLDPLYAWVRQRRKAPQMLEAQATQAAELRRLQTELKRVTEERD